MEEVDLEKKAVDEIMKEARRGAARADVSGPSGWKKCDLMKTNKRFLTNTLVQHINSNRIIEKKKTNKGRSFRSERSRSPSSDRESERRNRKHSRKRSRKDSASKSEKFRDSKVSKEKKKKKKHSKKDDGKRKKHKSKHRD